MVVPDDVVPAAQDTAAPDTGRRDAVLASALLTFARHGYRKTSMEEVARTARISRPGLYFLFASKQDLFRAAVTRALEEDLAAAEEILADTGKPLRERLARAFDRWAGRYTGPGGRDIPEVIEQNPDLLGPITRTAPKAFEALVTAAVGREAGREAGGEAGGGTAAAVAQTLISVSVGLKHQVRSREAYRRRMTTAVGLLVP